MNATQPNRKTKALRSSLTCVNVTFTADCDFRITFQHEEELNQTLQTLTYKFLPQVMFHHWSKHPQDN